MRSGLQRWRVPLGFGAAAALLVLAHPRPATLTLGLPIALAGLALRAAAAGHIRKNDVLATRGPYRFTRNPLYLGSSLLGAGLVVAAGSWWLALLAALMLVFVYLPVIKREEQYLADRFGTAFHAYAARVPRLLPRWRAAGASGAGPSFSLALYRRHREYQALLGFAALALALLLKWKLRW
ncbi:MAG TPA: isoprenylcysteine carboxylmethyltransferase family protein [Terriglobales bacterium]|nr:isoprenylcysteine carboxylmethyltransferase family protein [Terriglobales bacterium]